MAQRFGAYEEDVSFYDLVDIFFVLGGMYMNQIPWYQRLKEKRLEYGVSQNKLAVHIGISRQYISEIETGKVTPSDSLQAALFDVLEQFNPDVPLEILFDYVRIRFLTTNPKPVIEDILKLKMEYMLHEDYGATCFTING